MEVICSKWPCDWAGVAGSSAGEFEHARLAGHQREWLASLTSGLDHTAFLLEARHAGEVEGILPLVIVSGPVFGKFLVSLPYLNTGGVWAKTSPAATALIDHACRLADEFDVKYLELRHELSVEHPRLNFERTDKVHMRLTLPVTPDGVMKLLKSKVRSQVKKSGGYGLDVNFGGAELLSDFYAVFARNMRDLGTPVFSRNLFASILREFGGAAELCVIRKDSQAVAAGVLVHTDGVTEVPSASCLREFNRMNANMLMYRHMLERAVERGSHTFDFGRSSEGSGTYKFKAQWGALPSPACWHGHRIKQQPKYSLEGCLGEPLGRKIT